MNHKTYFLHLIKLYFSLNISYHFFVSPHFSYIGLVDNFSSANFIISIFIIIFFSLMIKINEDFLSNIFKAFFVVVSLIPALTLFTFKAVGNLFFVQWVSAFFFFILIFNSKINYKSVNVLPITINKNNLLIITFISFMIYLSTFGFNLNFEYFNILSETLYQGRESLTLKMSSIGILRYFFSNFQNVFLPLLLAFGLIKKNKIIIILSVLFFIYVFLSTTFKSVLLTPILIIGTFIIYQLSKTPLPILIIKNAYKIVLALCLFDYFLLFPFLNAVLVRRVFFLPALISEKYHIYFQENGFTYFSDLPFFEFLSINPFSQSIPETIGTYFIYNEGYMNAGFLADSYTKMGIFSVVLYLVALKLLVSFSDSNKDFKDEFIIFSIIIAPLIALANSSLTTTLFSHGLLLAFFVSSQIKKS